MHVHARTAFEGSTPVELARRADVPVVVRAEHLPELLLARRRVSCSAATGVAFSGDHLSEV